MATVATRPLRLAVAQYEPRVGELEHNRAQAVRWVAAAADAGARLVVLPELATSGYAFSSIEEARACAVDADSGTVVRDLVALCRERSLHVVTGLAESVAGRLHNSAVVLGPGGRLATYRKLHLFHEEQSWFSPGDGLPLVEIPVTDPPARLGVVVCFDIWFPEPARALALAGAEILAVPTNWVASFKRTVWDERGYCQGDYVAMATAAQNGLVVACADRIGEERGLTFLGASIVVGADGWPVAGPASRDGEALLVADVDLADVPRARRRTPRNDLLEGRRPQAYNAVLVAAVQPSPPLPGATAATP